MGVLNELLGPSIRLLTLELFLEEAEEMMNLREIARRLNKNPGSISRVLLSLLRDNLIRQVRVGKVIYAYHLNKESEVGQLLLEFYNRLKNLRGE
ncbi:MAG TPA: hypothetical protein ENF89_02065 [Candidatus Bathyarchaeota archaeon]|nr:hypothetical protein [Candidatus Bathyarchaeota archaeon]